MRVYLAAPWLDREQARTAAATITAAGHLVTHNWWDYEPDSAQPQDTAFLRRCAEQDLFGVQSADVVVVLNVRLSEGKAVEQGIAIANGIPVIIVGSKGSNVFHHLPLMTHVPDLPTALQYIDVPRRRPQ